MLIIQNNISSKLNSWLQNHNYSSIFVLVDQNTKQLCLPFIDADNFILIEIESGEKNKNLLSSQIIWESLLNNNADRNSLLINLGGGVICDMGAFCASTFKRGIDFINIPTTLLSQVDASVGSKTGIDFQGQKNMIGLFSEATVVFIDSVFIKTLDTRELLSGFAEVLKHGLIKDSSYFQECLSSYKINTIDWQNIISKSIEIKTNIVVEDPKEKGLRKILNFGHTIGHALESYSLVNHKTPLLHGEAVVLGMISELYLSSNYTGLKTLKSTKTIEQLQSIYSFNELEEFNFDKVYNFALNDKKNSKTNIKCVLLEDIGKAVYDIEISKKDFMNSLHFLNQKLSDA